MAPTAPPFLALIGDLVASRESPRRAALQAALAGQVAVLNAALGPEALAAPFALTAGDEVQGLLRAPGRAVEAIQLLTDALAGLDPAQGIAFGVGWGALSTGPLPAPPAQAANVALLDGPCFHAARASLEDARRERTWARFGGFGATEDLVLGGLFELMAALRSGWTEKQGQYAAATRRLGQQKKVAEEFGVSPSVVSESLKAARLEAVLRGEAAARALLEELGSTEGAG